VLFFFLLCGTLGGSSGSRAAYFVFLRPSAKRRWPVYIDRSVRVEEDMHDAVGLLGSHGHTAISCTRSGLECTAGSHVRLGPS
jgi:hypothetical protein